MIRSERSLREQFKKGHVKQSNLDCGQTYKYLVTTAKELLKKFPGGKIFVTADIVAYGSFTWGSAVNALGKRCLVDKAFKEAVVSFHNEQQKWEQNKAADLHCSFTACDCQQGKLPALVWRWNLRATCI